MSNRWTVLCAEYFVIVNGILLFLVSLEQLGMRNQVSIFISGTMLLLVSVAVTKVLKRLFRKRRPSRMVELFVPFDRYAFPSGHATGLASVTTFILTYDVMLGIISILISMVIVTARINSHIHDVYDMIVGGCVGMVITYLLLPSVVGYVTLFLVPVFL